LHEFPALLLRSFLLIFNFPNSKRVIKQ